jgi:hypothetical protein
VGTWREGLSAIKSGEKNCHEIKNPPGTISGAQTRTCDRFWADFQVCSGGESSLLCDENRNLRKSTKRALEGGLVSRDPEPREKHNPRQSRE